MKVTAKSLITHCNSVNEGLSRTRAGSGSTLFSARDGARCQAGPGESGIPLPGEHQTKGSAHFIDPGPGGGEAERRGVEKYPE